MAIPAVDTDQTRATPLSGGQSGIVRDCQHCGANFEPVKNNQLFCSPHCKNVFHEVDRAVSAIERHLVTINEAAKLTNLKPWQIRYAISKGKLGAVVILRRVAIRRSDLSSLISHHQLQEELPQTPSSCPSAFAAHTSQ